MNATCIATRKDGQPCTVRPINDSEYCIMHDPERETQRQAAKAVGGRNRAKLARAGKNLPPHLADAQQRLLDLIGEVHAGTIPARAAEVIGGLVGRLLDIAKFAHEIGQAAELEQKIEALEQQLKERAAQ
jgi:hypothetical protein